MVYSPFKQYRTYVFIYMAFLHISLFVIVYPCHEEIFIENVVNNIF